MPDNKYYISSFFWSTATKILNALIGFISVPLLMGYFGKANYGIMTLALACNGYMHILDLGINTGAVRYFSQWRASGNTEMIRKVSHTNITFYTIIAFINAVIMVLLGLFGENVFSISHDQFILLRYGLFSIAAFSLFSWVTTAFNQLLVSDMQMAFTMKIQFIQVILKGILIFLVLKIKMSLPQYFVILNMLMAMLVIPYAIKCLKDGLIDNIKPGFYWKEFRVVFMFSLSLFALSIFQMTATESRPIILGIFNPDGANTVTDFRVISVVPALIITIGGTLSAIFLPGSSELVAKKDQAGIEHFAYKWTKITSIVANILCVPFILCAREVLIAYVGNDFAHLSIWLIIWCVTALIQVHTTPGNSLVIAYGKTKPLVITTAISCVISIAINILLCRSFGAGSAIIGYFIYVLIVIGLYYFVYYKKLMGLDRIKMLKSFLVPTIISFAVLACARLVKIDISWFSGINIRLAYIIICIIKTMIWLIPYIGILFATGVLKFADLKKIRSY
ncbi:MAG: oligosaccharide flippase family protein [Bacteroidales bacterium]|jgi:O-antigen/teichoic acid export membrane protein|nr:oligosaccharide flippase family protein [Bacteroidales bacterium]MCI1785042.1 oligosaccharide flippase family protein [Bacteroidales bacterium]